MLTINPMLLLQQHMPNSSNCCNAWRWYSDKGSNTSSRKTDEKDDDDDDTSNDNNKQSKRTVPKLGENLVVWPNFFLSIKNSCSIIYAHLFFDQQLTLMEFMTGAKHALQVPTSNLSLENV